MNKKIEGIIQNLNWTKGELMKFTFGDCQGIDSAIPCTCDAYVLGESYWYITRYDHGFSGEICYMPLCLDSYKINDIMLLNNLFKHANDSEHNLKEYYTFLRDFKKKYNMNN